jgi:hypothetical protein
MLGLGFDLKLYKYSAGSYLIYEYYYSLYQMSNGTEGPLLIPDDDRFVVLPVVNQNL